jgi:hypothetical protein
MMPSVGMSLSPTDALLAGTVRAEWNQQLTETHPGDRCGSQSRLRMMQLNRLWSVYSTGEEAVEGVERGL